MSLEVSLEISVLALPFGCSLCLEDDEGHGAFTPLGVRASDDGYLKDIGVGSKFYDATRQSHHLQTEEPENKPCSIARLDAFSPPEMMISLLRS